MKIGITNKLFVILSRIFDLKTIIGIVGLLIIGIFIVAFSYNSLHFNSAASLYFFFMIFTLPIIYIVYIYLDAKVYANNSYIEIKDRNIDVYSKNLTRKSNVSIPTAQVQSINITQNFTRKIFKVCQINFLQQSGIIVSIWGFNYNDALGFVNEFGNKYSIPISK